MDIHYGEHGVFKGKAEMISVLSVVVLKQKRSFVREDERAQFCVFRGTTSFRRLPGAPPVFWRRQSSGALCLTIIRLSR